MALNDNTAATQATQAYDTTAPTVAITDDNAGTANGNVTFTFTFSEAVNGFTVDDVVVTGGTKAGSFATGADGSSVYTLVITPTADTQAGTITVDVAGAVAKDLALNDNTAATQATQAYDTKAPTVALTYSENPANVGAMIVTATYSEAVASTPNISIDQQGSTDITTVAMTPGAAGVYTYDYTVVADNGVTYKDGTATVSLSSVNDAAGNTAGAPTGTTFVIDTTAPTVTSTTIASNNADTTQAKVGDVVTLTFVSSEGVQTPTVTIAENGATVTQGIDNQHWTATYTMLSGDVAGVVAFNIAFTDLAGNVGTSVTATSDTSSVTFDKIAPGPTAVTIDSDSDGDTDTDYAKVGDTVTLVFTSDENIKNPTVTILGHDATEAGAGTSWTATYVVQSGDTEGTVTFAIDYSDLAGNAGAQVSTVTNSSSVVFDETDPDAPDYRTNEGQWFKSNPTLDIDFSDDVELEKVEYKLNSGGSWRDIETDINDNNYNDNWSMSSGDWDSMNDGSNYYLYFRITDKAGNVYETDDNGEAFYLRKDNDDPSAPTYVTAEDQTFFSNPVLDIDFSDSWTLDKVKYQLDGVGGTWTTLATGLSGKTYTTNWSMTTGIWDNLATGTHYIYFQITDDAGNDYETGSNGAGFLFYKNSGSGGTIAGVESNGAVDGGEGAVQGDQAPAGDQGVLGDGANKDGAVAPVGDTPWYRTLPFEVAAVIVLIGSTIWWWIRRRGSSGGVGILGSFMFTTLKTVASRVRMFFW